MVPNEARVTAVASESRTHRILRWALLALPVVILAEQVFFVAMPLQIVNGFITLRVVSQIVNGNGPVFNIGERVEASTSPMWTYMLAVGDILTPIRLEWIAVVSGIALSLAGVTFAIFGARALVRNRQPDELLAPVGVEVGLVFGWLGLTLWALAQWSRVDAPLPRASAVLIGLGPLIRPELVLYSALFLLVVIAGRRRDDSWADRGRLLAWALALPVAYQIFRMGYYASLVPNPAIAKEASRARWDEGWEFFGRSVGPYVLWLPIALLVIGAYVPLVRDLRADRRAKPLLVGSAFVVGGIVHAVYTVRVGGDFMHARLLLPSLFALVAPVAVVPVRKRYAVSFLVVPWMIAGLFFLRSGVDDGAFVTGQQNAVTIDDFENHLGGPGLPWFRGDGVYYVTEKLPAEPVDGRRVAVAAYGLGTLGYRLGPDTYVLDLFGLGDAFTSHLELKRRGLIGHEKPLPPPWIAARLTKPGASLTADDFPFSFAFGARPIDDPRASFEQRERIARATLECPGLRDFLKTYDAALTPGRFFGNLVESVGNTRLRIPAEPADAYEKFCGRPPPRALRR